MTELEELKRRLKVAEEVIEVAGLQEIYESHLKRKGLDVSAPDIS